MDARHTEESIMGMVRMYGQSYTAKGSATGFFHVACQRTLEWPWEMMGKIGSDCLYQEDRKEEA